MLSIFVLIWKHLLVRKRRLINTLVQLVSPIVLLFCLYYLNYRLLGEFRETFRVNKTEKFSMKDEGVVGTTPLRVLYTPRTTSTDALMAAAADRLGLPHLDHVPGVTEKGIAPLSNEEEMARFVRKMQRSDAIVIFRNDMYEGLPSSLEYTIRMKMDFDPGQEVAQPLDKEEVYRAELSNAMFVHVQWAVDKSYLQMLTGEKIPQRLKLVSKNKVKVDFMAPYLIWIAAILCSISHAHVFLYLVTSLLDEKVTGIHDMLKLMGVPVTAILMSHFVNALPAGLVYSLAGAKLLKAGPYAILMNTPYANIAGVLFLHYCAVIAMGMFLAALIHSRQRQATIVIMVYFLLAGIAFEFIGRNLIRGPKDVGYPSIFINALAWIPPHGGMWLFMSLAAVEEKYDRPQTAMIWPLLIPAVHTGALLLLAIIIFYLMPSTYIQGGSLLPSLSFKRITALINKRGRPPGKEEEPSKPSYNQAFFEELPERPIGVEVIDVCMEYQDKLVLDNVALAALDGEITVLVGHNGAGKTTLLNIICGLLKPKSGDVLVNGYNTRTETSDVRSLLGHCPQRDLYHADLTVAEHYRIIAMLKGVIFNKKRYDELMTKLNLTNKTKYLVGHLSAGMRRRVQLACALAGGATVLVLDEPTSGLDLEARREIWDILLALRGEHTVLLTTHHMEEADAIGDRVAALHMGRVVCFATPMFLKEALGYGYRLTLATTNEVKERQLTELVRRNVPNAVVTSRNYKRVTFDLPAKHGSRFPALLDRLDGARSSHGIETIGVSNKSALDDVFLKLCTDIKANQCKIWQVKGEKIGYTRLPFYSRYFWQFFALLKRYAFYVWANKISFLLLKLLLPLLLLTALSLRTASYPTKIRNSTKLYSLGLDLYRDTPTYVMFDSDRADYVPIMRSGYKGIEFSNVADFTEDMFKTDAFRIGIHINDTHATAVYTDAGPLAAPAAVNVLSNTLAARLAGNPRAVTTLVNNDPEDENTYGLFPPKNKYIARLYCVTIVFLAMVHLSGFVALLSAEREAGTRHALLMAGCPLPLYWLVTFIVQVWFTLLVVAVPGCVLAYALDADATFRQTDFILTFFLLLVLATMANCSFNNVIGQFLSDDSAANAAVAFAILIGLMLGTVDRLILENAFSGTTFYMLIEACFCVMPPQVAVVGALQVARVAVANAWCYNNHDLCPGWFTKDELADEVACCNSTRGPTQSYYSIDSKGAGGELIFLSMQFAGYTLLFMILESRIMAPFFAAVAWPTKSRFTDPAIDAEKRYVEKAIKIIARKKLQDAVLADKLCKKYVARCIAFAAVRGVSFCVKKGECFGLIGVNGTGKTTTFKMLSAEIHPSHGKLISGGYFYIRRYKYMNTYSYCAQHQNLDTFLTGRQNLDLMMTMRGFDRNVIEQETQAWLDDFGLTEHADRRLSTYSGGCSRRLAAAAALCQRAPTTLLDEPTAGVDPAARRCIHAVIVRTKRADRSVIISSQNMDEMEALCERMALLSGGRVATLGSGARLRCRYGKSYTVTFKLKPTEIAPASDADADNADDPDAATKPGRAEDADEAARLDAEQLDDRGSGLASGGAGGWMGGQPNKGQDSMLSADESQDDRCTCDDTLALSGEVADCEGAVTQRLNRSSNSVAGFGPSAQDPSCYCDDVSDTAEMNAKGQAAGQAGAHAIVQARGHAIGQARGHAGQAIGQEIGQAGGQAIGQAGRRVIGPAGGRALDQEIGQAGGQAIGQAGRRVIGPAGGRALDQEIGQAGGQAIGQAGGRVTGPAGGQALGQASGQAGGWLFRRRTGQPDDQAEDCDNAQDADAVNQRKNIGLASSAQEDECICPAEEDLAKEDLAKVDPACVCEGPVLDEEKDPMMLRLLGPIDVDPDVVPNAEGLATLDAEMHRRFECDLTDDRKVMLQYRIKPSMSYSELFIHMEQIKRMYPNLIAEYSLTDTTLEDVFLYFAKEAIEHKKKLKLIKKQRKRREAFFKKWCYKTPRRKVTTEP